MRLLIVSQYFWPENFRINDLVSELVRRGHHVTVLTGVPNYPTGQVFPEFRDDPSQFREYGGAEVIRVPMMPRGHGALRLFLNYVSYAASAATIGLWRLRGRKFDAIFTCQLSPVTVGLPAAAFRAVKRAPMVLWVLDLWPDTLQAIGVIRSKFVLRAVGRLTSFVYRHSDLILAQSKSFIPQIRKRAGRDSRIEYFPSWAEQLFGSEEIAPAEEVPPKPGAFNVMFAGNIGDAQDFPAILKAADILRPHAQIRWLILGDGRAAWWVAREIERRDLQDAVLMLGRYPVERMPSFFRHADALLVSLKDEPIFSMTIPGKLQSYLASGISVIAMLNGEGADLVRESKSGLTCAAGDHVGLAAAILELSKMTEEARLVYGKNGLSVTTREFDRSTLVDRLERWLEDLGSLRPRKQDERTAA